jgi:hypothetical protein
MTPDPANVNQEMIAATKPQISPQNTGWMRFIMQTAQQMLGSEKDDGGGA